MRSRSPRRQLRLRRTAEGRADKAGQTSRSCRTSAQCVGGSTLRAIRLGAGGFIPRNKSGGRKVLSTRRTLLLGRIELEGLANGNVITAVSNRAAMMAAALPEIVGADRAWPPPTG